jgi:hypothetical protein
VVRQAPRDSLHSAGTFSTITDIVIPSLLAMSAVEWRDRLTHSSLLPQLGGVRHYDKTRHHSKEV